LDSPEVDRFESALSLVAPLPIPLWLSCIFHFHKDESVSEEAGVSLSFTEFTTFLEQVKNNRMNSPCNVLSTRKTYQTGSRSTNPATRPDIQVNPIKRARRRYRKKLILGPVAVIFAVDLELSQTTQDEDVKKTTFIIMMREKGATK